LPSTYEIGSANKSLHQTACKEATADLDDRRGFSETKAFSPPGYSHMKTFIKYSITVVIVLSIVLVVAWYYASGEHFISVSLICYGFLLGYLSAWFHIGRRLGYRSFSRFLADNSGI
jgi:hypothetical protein